MSPKRDPIFEELDRCIAEEERRAALTPAACTRQALQRPAGRATSQSCQQPARSLDRSACGSKEKTRARVIAPWELRRARYLRATGRMEGEEAEC
jgi:hypothetical protein